MIRAVVGARIKKMRMDQGMSQEELALKAGIDRTYLASVEKGKRNIAVLNIQKIIIGLSTTFEEFFRGI